MAASEAPEQVWEPTGHATVVVDNVTMEYRTATTELPHGRGARMQHRLRAALGLSNHTSVHALKGVSFVAHEGESIGLVGQNGAGKSTLLRTIAGVEPPTTGKVYATSTPVLLGINAALVPALSGERNIQLGLLALGLPPSSVEKMIPQVAKLSGIGAAIKRPMSTYSSGMGARLRFAIAAAYQPDIMLIDEALGAGDAAFASRSDKVVKRLRENAGTIFLVSHAAQTVENTCNRAIWLHNGEVLADGPARDTARKYRWWAWNVAQDEPEVAAKLLDQAREEFADRRAANLDEVASCRAKRR